LGKVFRCFKCDPKKGKQVYVPDMYIKKYKLKGIVKGKCPECQNWGLIRWGEK